MATPTSIRAVEVMIPHKRQIWMKIRTEKKHNANLFMTNEFNPSQVCSKCHHFFVSGFKQEDNYTL